MVKIVPYEQPFMFVDESLKKIEYATGQRDFQFVSFVVKNRRLMNL